MSVDTTRVTGRRQVRYETFEDLLAEAEQMAGGEICSLGNWSLGQTLKHLGLAMEGSISGEPFPVPWWVRLLGVVYLRRKLVYGPFPPGFKLPRAAREKLVPGETIAEEGLAVLRAGIDRLRSETKRIPHPVAGKLSVDEWNRLHLTHAEMHMSFLVPEGGSKSAIENC